MVTAERASFNVPEKNLTGRYIELEGEIFEPTHPAGTAIFSPGIWYLGNLWYRQFAERLAEEFKVVTFSQRGCGRSEGRLKPYSGSDLESVVNSIEPHRKGKFLLVGHSFGSSSILQAVHNSIPSRMISGVYLINPYLDAYFHRVGALVPEAVAPLVARTAFAGFLFYRAALDMGLYSGEVLDFQKSHPKFLRIVKSKLKGAEILVAGAGVSVPNGGYEVPVAFALADNDEFLGTSGDTKRYSRLVRRIESAVPGAVDCSESVHGLNHALNIGNNYRLFAEQSGNGIIDSIFDFEKRQMTDRLQTL